MVPSRANYKNVGWRVIRSERRNGAGQIKETAKNDHERPD